VNEDAASPALMRTAEQEQFAATLHDALRSAATPAIARQWAAGDRAAGEVLWRSLAALGVTGLTVPQSRGGLGAGLADVIVACEELGHHAVPGPVAESVAAVPRLLASLNDERLAQRWLPALAGGESLLTLAAPPLLPYAADADAAAAVLLIDGDTLWLASPGEPRRSVDPARSLSAVRGRQVLARGPAVAAAAAPALEAGVLACAALLLGAGRSVLDASVRHAAQRVQFGRPVGAFQAVKHKLADVAIGLEFARPLLAAAAAALDAGEPTAARDVSAARVACADAAYRAARVGLQVHGAIGYTQDHDLHLWLGKIRALVSTWGSQAAHRARVMAAITGAAP
jgi:alkylation response protein AidB-like acyl-CoA dehydrogenase